MLTLHCGMSIYKNKNWDIAITMNLSLKWKIMYIHIFGLLSCNLFYCTIEDVWSSHILPFYSNAREISHVIIWVWNVYLQLHSIWKRINFQCWEFLLQIKDSPLKIFLSCSLFHIFYILRSWPPVPSVD